MATPHFTAYVRPRGTLTAFLDIAASIFAGLVLLAIVILAVSP